MTLLEGAVESFPVGNDAESTVSSSGSENADTEITGIYDACSKRDAASNGKSKQSSSKGVSAHQRGIHSYVSSQLHSGFLCVCTHEAAQLEADSDAPSTTHSQELQDVMDRLKEQGAKVKSMFLAGGGLMAVNPSNALVLGSREQCMAVFMGKIHNVPELIEKHEIQEVSDKGQHQNLNAAELVCILYQKRGVAMLSELQGKFTFCLYDPKLVHVLAVRGCEGSFPLTQAYSQHGHLLIASGPFLPVGHRDAVELKPNEYKFGWHAAPVAYEGALAAANGADHQSDDSQTEVKTETGVRGKKSRKKDQHSVVSVQSSGSKDSTTTGAAHAADSSSRHVEINLPDSLDDMHPHEPSSSTSSHHQLTQDTQNKKDDAEEKTETSTKENQSRLLQDAEERKAADGGQLQASSAREKQRRILIVPVPSKKRTPKSGSAVADTATAGSGSGNIASSTDAASRGQQSGGSQSQLATQQSDQAVSVGKQKKVFVPIPLPAKKPVQGRNSAGAAPTSAAVPDGGAVGEDKKGGKSERKNERKRKSKQLSRQEGRGASTTTGMSGGDSGDDAVLSQPVQSSKTGAQEGLIQAGEAQDAAEQQPGSSQAAGQVLIVTRGKRQLVAIPVPIRTRAEPKAVATPTGDGPSKPADRKGKTDRTRERKKGGRSWLPWREYRERRKLSGEHPAQTGAAVGPSEVAGLSNSQDAPQQAVKQQHVCGRGQGRAQASAAAGVQPAATSGSSHDGHHVLSQQQNGPERGDVKRGKQKKVFIPIPVPAKRAKPQSDVEAGQCVPQHRRGDESVKKKTYSKFGWGARRSRHGEKKTFTPSQRGNSRPTSQSVVQQQHSRPLQNGQQSQGQKSKRKVVPIPIPVKQKTVREGAGNAEA